MFHSFTKFHRNVSILFSSLCIVSLTVCFLHTDNLQHVYLLIYSNPFILLQIISPTTLFLAAKVEEQPRKLEHVIKVAHACLNPQETPLDTKSNVSMGIVGFIFPSHLPACPILSMA